MFLFSNKKIILLAVGIILSCATVQARTDAEEITINFEAYVGEDEFSCGESYDEIGVNESTITPTDFRFYVSDVALIDEDGNSVPLELEQDDKWQYQNVALLDFENGTEACDNGTAETRTQIVGKVPQGNYDSLQFTLGVPQELNHEDAAIAPSPLNLTSMWWNWQGGYKFLRVDLETEEAIANVSNSDHSHSNQSDRQASILVNDDTHGQTGHTKDGDHQASSNSYLIHLGSTGCSASAQSSLFDCANPNRVEVLLEDFDAQKNVVIADLAQLLAASDLTTNEANTPNGCMSSPEDSDCNPILESLSLLSTTEEQTFFSVE